MPPDLDIYVLTRERNLPTIERFLDTYADRAASEDRRDEELMMVRIGVTATSYANSEDDYEWESSSTMANAIARGLDYPRRAFNLYWDSRVPKIEKAILGFTMDDLLVLGLSIDDTEERPETLTLAQELLTQLAEICEGYLGAILVEEPPPIHELAFRQREGAFQTLQFWDRMKG